MSLRLGRGPLLTLTRIMANLYPSSEPATLFAHLLRNGRHRIRPVFPRRRSRLTTPYCIGSAQAVTPVQADHLTSERGLTHACELSAFVVGVLTGHKDGTT